MSDRLEIALRFAAMGWKLFPAKWNRKTGQHIGRVSWGAESSSDPETIKAWARKWPDAHFCVAIAQSDLTVIDVDDKNGKTGSQSLQVLESEHGPLPATVESATPSGGRHLVFNGFTRHENRGRLGSGIDIPVMIPLPGSMVKGKGEYRIIRNGSVADIPGWLRKTIGEARMEKSPKAHIPAVDLDQPHNVIEAIEYAKMAPPSVEGNNGDDNAVAVARSVRDYGISETVCLEILWRYWNDTCEPPWEFSELETKVKNAYRYAKLPAGSTRPEAEFEAVEEGAKGKKPQTKADLIAAMNAKHAVIMVGGKCAVMNEVMDPVFNRPDISLSTKTDFFDLYAHKQVPHSSKTISIAKMWFGSPKRRQYKGIVFEPGKEVPGYYNMWRGFAIEPRKGDWSLYRRLIEEVIADGVKERAEWILAWMARIVQDPGGERPGTSIVLQGGMGTGKGTFANHFGRLFGRHYLQLSNPSQVVGRFNGHLKDALTVFVDEGFWAGDKTAEGVIKNMVTETILNIEQKGKDIFQIRNHINLIIASNSSWVVPAGMDERRFFVIRVSDRHQQDKGYFKAIHEQMKDGGLEALLYDLMEMDISGVDLRTFEKTEALFEQKLASMDSVKKYWFERLKEGNLTRHDDEWENEVVSERQYKDYLEFASEIRDYKPKCRVQFAIELKKMCPKMKSVRQRIAGENREEDTRVRARWFPDLDICRGFFEEIIQSKIKWDDENDEYDFLL